jgi:serine/threonine protein kinase/formylglycine-generating enzyme required for sulfatase activity
MTDPSDAVPDRRDTVPSDPATRAPQLSAAAAPQDGVGRVPPAIGPYHIVRELGSGGMGTVWLAEQHEPVRRRVAIKVLRTRLASREFLTRFQFERQALAAMNHRCIAKVLDGGSTELGEPYYVMELVEGLPLTDYCDKHRLALHERLALFQLICQGVHHAHMKGIVHRDLKPGNVLVVREDGAALPKIVDFGLAKATHGAFSTDVAVTMGGQMLGTPEYMSPEQAAGDGEAVDSRSDIYSLGIMLYELLAGDLPFSGELLRSAGLGGARQVICYQDPDKPSARLASSHNLPTLAEHRRTTTGMLRKALQGDLDWIVLKAMAKEPERRYDAATALAAEIDRYLRQEPVLAGPPTLRYRVGKYVRRHRLQLGAALIVLLTLLAGIAGSTWFAFDAMQQAERAADNARVAQRRSDEFDDLAGVVLLERANTTAQRLHPPWPEQVNAMQSWLDGDVAKLIAMRPRLQQTLLDLQTRAAAPNGSDGPRRESQQFLREALAALVPKIESLQQEAVPQVQERLAWARRIRQLTEAHRGARATWAEAAAAIAAADGIRASLAYRTSPLPGLAPQMGLVPIGMNPVTKLWEFYDLRSAWDGKSDPAEIPIPVHRADGSIEVTPATGIVMVLVPGGTFRMGATPGPDGANCDAAAKPEESPVHEVTLLPFFLARHELTQAQWQRLWYGEPALAQPSAYPAGQTFGRKGRKMTLTNPVEQVSWLMGDRLLNQNGMQLPTEAQWEYACRAGSTTPWPCVEDELVAHANVADESARQAGVTNDVADWDDGFSLHAPVGSFLANAFGMHDMQGNVAEWCFDEVGDYQGPVRQGDGLHTQVLFAGQRMIRGGSFGFPASLARSANRGAHEPSVRNTDSGVRPARTIR